MPLPLRGSMRAQAQQSAARAPPGRGLAQRMAQRVARLQPISCEEAQLQQPRAKPHEPEPEPEKQPELELERQPRPVQGMQPELELEKQPELELVRQQEPELRCQVARLAFCQAPSADWQCPQMAAVGLRPPAHP